MWPYTSALHARGLVMKSAESGPLAQWVCRLRGGPRGGGDPWVLRAFVSALSYLQNHWVLNLISIRIFGSVAAGKRYSNLNVCHVVCSHLDPFGQRYFHCVCGWRDQKKKRHVGSKAFTRHRLEISPNSIVWDSRRMEKSQGAWHN